LELEPDAGISNGQQLVEALLRDSPGRDMLSGNDESESRPTVLMNRRPDHTKSSINDEATGERINHPIISGLRA
jgi:hypothetical protein